VNVVKLENPREKEYREVVRSAVPKVEHVQLDCPEEILQNRGVRLYTVTTMAASSSLGGTRTVAVCSSFERAREIVESNEGDIFETSYHLVVIEAVVADWLYYPLADEQYWFVWKPDSLDKVSGRYVPIEQPAAYEGMCNFGIG
jgi:hypothetical protein